MIGEFEFWDLLYRRYANPMELMNFYIDQGRFGEFVSNFIRKEDERKREKQEKDDDWMLWVAYIHGVHEESFNEWKETILNQAIPAKIHSNAENLTSEQTAEIINGAFEVFH